MHEYPITLQIIKIAEKYAVDHPGCKIKRIHVVAGDDSGYVPDTVKLYFDEISKGTQCEGGELLIRRVRPKLRCTSCGALFERKLFSFVCPQCGGEGEPSEIGKEFYVESIEVEIGKEGETDGRNN
jgi:hydrogenase nickel incorporation protein HypA/HybF